MSTCMNKSLRNWLMLGTLIVVAVLAMLAGFLIISTLKPNFGPRYPWELRERPPEIVGEDFELFYTIEAVVSTINVVLSFFLLLTYIEIYRKTRSDFAIGLTIFSAIFLLNAVASNPFVTGVFGFRPFGLGPFAMLPNLFTLGALSVLLYLSIKY